MRDSLWAIEPWVVAVWAIYWGATAFRHRFFGKYRASTGGSEDWLFRNVVLPTNMLMFPLGLYLLSAYLYDVVT